MVMDSSNFNSHCELYEPLVLPAKHLLQCSTVNPILHTGTFNPSSKGVYDKKKHLYIFKKDHSTTASV